MRSASPLPRHCRRGSILVLSAFLIVVMLAMVAFTVDLGFLTLTKSQLQTAADSAALAAAANTNLPRAEMEAIAQKYAGYHSGGGRPVNVLSNDIEYGTWDSTARTFTPSPSPSNAVKVTARTSAASGGETPLFFARIFNQFSVSQSSSAVATANPRDICFVVDLSGSMNDDTDPANTDSLNSKFAAQGYPTIGTDLMQQVYNDFGYGSYPGTSQYIGQSLGMAKTWNLMSEITKDGGVLTKSTIPTTYRIKNSDSSSTRQWKARAWCMDVQIRALMPAARPTPSSGTNYNYWREYIDSYIDELGYRSYMQFMMAYGRDVKPDDVNYTPLSQFSPDCPWHSEGTAAGSFNFPPREQPTHAARRALIAALKVIEDRNSNIVDTNQRDWVSIVTFDRLSPGPIIEQPLTGDYRTAMQACTRLQATGGGGYSTATEAGLITGREHIKGQSEGGSGRNTTNKVVVLLTDGQPNLYQSSNTLIQQYVSAHPNSSFYSSGSYAKQAPLVQTMQMQLDRWSVFPVGIGLDTDYDFMDRLASIGKTANKDGQCARGSGNPADYEARLTEIFERIITNPKLRLVQ